MRRRKSYWIYILLFFCINNQCSCGFYFTECSVGVFGKDCVENCSMTCGDPGVCDKVTGHCNGKCLPGWEGNLCQNGNILYKILFIRWWYLLFNIYVLLFSYLNLDLSDDIFKYSRQNQQRSYQLSFIFHLTNTLNFIPFRVFGRVLRSELFTELQHDLWNPWELWQNNGVL